MKRTQRPALAVVVAVGVLLTASVLIAQVGGPTAAPTSAEVHFTASGDIAANSDSAAVLTKVHDLGSDLHLALGDLSYGTTGQEQSWCDFVLAKVGPGFPFELISGNHESDGTMNGNINDFSACLPNQLPGLVGVYGREWYVDVPEVNPLARFVMISPNLQFPGTTLWTYAAGTSHYNWTAAAIDGARSNNIPWVIVGMHKPCLSVGAYGCDPGRGLIDLLTTKKVDLVLSGHDHLYQRTHQLATTSSCLSIVPGVINPACVADADSDFSRGAGTVFTTAGTGGIPLRDVNAADADAPYFATYSGLNANPTHGTLDVKLTRDSMIGAFVGASGGTYTDSFTIRPAGPAPNAAPVARFTGQCTALQCSFDGATSTDSDGSIASYNWSFGDGSSGTGVNTNKTYGASGTYSVSLTVTDDAGATNTSTRSFTVGVPANVPPTAAATVACTNLSCSFSGTGSSDPDGTIASYAWSYGDGSSGTGATPTHSYAAAGTFQATLTVTDDDGATNSTAVAAKPVAPPTSFVADAFSRSLTGGWGSADVGGAWSLAGGASNFSVSDGQGRIRIAAGGGAPGAALSQATAASTDLSFGVTFDKPATGSGTYVWAVPRRVPSQGDYRAKVRLTSTGSVGISLTRANAAGTETSLVGEAAVSGLQYVTGDRLNVRAQASGTNPTTVRMRVWKHGTAEPGAWQASFSDSTPALQTAGSVAVLTYLSSGTTNAPVVISVDDVVAKNP